MVGGGQTERERQTYRQRQRQREGEEEEREGRVWGDLNEQKERKGGQRGMMGGMEQGEWKAGSEKETKIQRVQTDRE